jgi:hypothetical protein
VDALRVAVQARDQAAHQLAHLLDRYQPRPRGGASARRNPCDAVRA